MTTRICPDCGQPIEVDENEIPAGSIVRHDLGACPTAQREEQYEYRATFTVRRTAVDDDEDEGVVLTSITEEMAGSSFKAVGAELATKVGRKLDLVLEKASLIDLP